MTELCQFFTPFWLAEALVDRHFGDLTERDLVLEPSCGLGAFLNAVPAHVPAVGVEIDPQVAAIAAADTGRQVVVGDFVAAPLDVRPTAIVGNPPFRVALIERFLQRCHQLLPEGGRAGFVLPAYAMQTSRRVAEYRAQWSMAVEIIPRDAFPRLREPLIFGLFTKDEHRRLFGIALVDEAADVLALPAPYRQALQSTRGRWRAVCTVALQRLGGRATLPDLYREIERARPTRNRFWREKVRQTLRHYAECFEPLGEGAYALRGAA